MNFYRSSASFYRTKHNDRVFVPHFPLVDLPAVLFVKRRGTPRQSIYKPFTSALLAMAAASWSMAEAMPRWRISGLTNTAAAHGEYCGRCTQSFWMTEQLPTGIPSTSATTVYGTLSFCVWVRSQANTTSAESQRRLHH